MLGVMRFVIVDHAIIHGLPIESLARSPAAAITLLFLYFFFALSADWLVRATVVEQAHLIVTYALAHCLQFGVGSEEKLFHDRYFILLKQS